MHIRRFIATSAMLVLCLAPSLVHADPGEDLYREARRALTAQEYGIAARQFAEAAELAEDIDLRADSMYWTAFALYKQDDIEALYESAYVLEDLIRDYPGQALAGDAGSLAARVEGELARRGDARYAERLARTAERLEHYAEELDRREEQLQREEEAERRRAEDLERDRRPDAPVAPRAERVPTPPEPVPAPEPPLHDESMKVAALNALLNADPERAVPILRKLLATPDRNGVELRKKAVFLVSQHPTEETGDILLDVVKNDPSVEVRADAVFWLSQVPGEASIEALEHILRDSREPELQEKAVFALSQHPGLRTGAILRDLAADREAAPHVREQAIFWLSRNGGEETFDFLADLYGSLDSRTLKEKVLFSLSQLGDRRCGPWMLDIARDTREPLDLRKNALFWMSRTGEVDGDGLLSLYRSMDERELKEQLIFGLSQMPCDESMDTLIELARHDEDPDLREKAVFWIGQSNCEEALGFLEELIGN